MSNKTKILIVDDVEVNRFILKEYFIDQYDILEAENGLDALNIIEKYYESISIVILDVVMPVMSGLELLKLINQNPLYSKLSVVIITGVDDLQNEMKALNLGAVDFITKPFDPDLVINRINNVISKKEVKNLTEENKKLAKQTIFKDKYEKLIDFLPYGFSIYEISDDVDLIYANKCFYEMLGYEKLQDGSYIKPDKNNMLKYIDDLIRKFKINNSFDSLNEQKISLSRNDGTVFWVSVKYNLIETNNNSSIYAFIFDDITKEIKYENELVYRLEYDDVTNIYNKDTFYRKAHELLIKNRNENYCIVCLNIDRFAVLNDLYGMDEGNKLLKYIGNNLATQTKKYSCISGRLYADTFAMCMPMDMLNVKNLELASKLCTSSYPLDMQIIIRFGIFVVDDPYLSVNIMCDRANMAINSIKGNYKKFYTYYNDNQRDSLLVEQEIINDASLALEKEQFIVYFQPKFHLENNQLIGAEALVRWKHPKKGLISPDKFIKIFEKNGFISSLDEYVWEHTCKKLREWMDAGYMVVPVSVNVSRVDIYNPNLCDILSALTRKYDIPISLLNLEITETAYTENPSQLIEIIEGLKNSGFIIEMDDFGNGYSSLNMLNEVPVDVLKLDLKFLKPKLYSRGGNILNSVVSMAKWLNLPVVAEGIENKDQVDFLRSIGCNRGQGFYFYKPLECEEFEKLIRFDSNENNNFLFEESIQLEEFCDPNSQINKIFNNFDKALIIFEATSENVNILRENNKFCEITSIDREKLFSSSKNMLDFICEVDRDFFLNQLNQIKEKNDDLTFECRWNYSKNTEIYVNMRVKLLSSINKGGVFLCLLEDYRLNNNKASFKGNEFIVKSFSTKSHDVIFELDYKTRIITNIVKFQKKFGYTPPMDNFPLLPVQLGIVKKSDADIFYSAFQDLDDGKAIADVNVHIKGHNADYVLCRMIVAAIRNENNELIKVMGLITEE